MNLELSKYNIPHKTLDQIDYIVYQDCKNDKITVTMCIADVDFEIKVRVNNIKK